MLGAEVYPVPAVAFENPKNYNHQAREFAEKTPNAVWTDQFDNTANADAHYRTTGPEIWAQTEGKVDAFTCSTGTGGTLAGVSRFLREKSQGRVKSYLADPPGSVLYSYITSGGKLTERQGGSITEGALLTPDDAYCLNTRSAGIGQGRVTKNLGTEIDHISGALHIPDEKSIAMLYEMLDTEGLYLGASTALNVVAAYELARRLGPGRYLAVGFKIAIDRVPRKNCGHYSLRRSVSVSEPTILEEMDRVKGAFKGYPGPSPKILCVRLAFPNSKKRKRNCLPSWLVKYEQIHGTQHTSQKIQEIKVVPFPSSFSSSKVVAWWQLPSSSPFPPYVFASSRALQPFRHFEYLRIPQQCPHLRRH